MIRKIFLPIEIKKRELPSRIYLSLVAAKKGYSSILGHKSKIFKFQHYCINSNILTKSLPRNDTEFLRNLKKQNNNIYYIHEEGLMSFDDRFTHRMIDPKVLKIVDKVFTWGNEQTNAMRKIFDMDNYYLAEVGNPRIDVLIKLKKFFQAEAQIIKKKYGKFILVATKYGKINFLPRDDSKFNYIDNQIKKGHIKDKYLEDLGRESVDHEKKNFYLYLDFLKKYSKRKQKLIILRPHPGENIDFWQKELKNFENIKVIHDHQSTNSWILASDFLISNNCTTSLEAYLLGKKSINFIPFKNSKIEYPIPRIVSTTIRTIDEMIEFCDNFKENDIIQKNEIKSKLSKYISSIINFDCSEKIIDIIETNRNNINRNNINRNNYFFLLKDALVIIKNIKRRIFNNETFMTKLSNQKFKNITLSEVKNIIQHIDDLNNYKITEFKPGLINIKLNKIK